MARVRPPTPRFQVGQTEKGELVFPSTELIQTLEEIIQRTGGLGDVTLLGSLSAGSSTDNAVARYDGSNGDRLQTSLVTVSDTGDISVPSGATVDGRDVSVDGSKLDGIENGATADQTASEIKTLYESNSDTNAFTDSEQNKLAGIQAGAEVNAVDSVFGRTGSVTAQAGDYSAYYARVDGTASSGPVALASYTVAGLPSASPAAQFVYVTDEAGGAVPAFSDGTDWRRVTDRNVVTT
jgi:hypothetical protein